MNVILENDSNISFNLSESESELLYGIGLNGYTMLDSDNEYKYDLLIKYHFIERDETIPTEIVTKMHIDMYEVYEYKIIKKAFILGKRGKTLINLIDKM